MHQPAMLDCHSQKTSTRRSKEEPKTGTSMPKGKKYLQLFKGIFCNTITELVKGKLKPNVSSHLVNKIMSSSMRHFVQRNNGNKGKKYKEILRFPY